MDIINAVPEKYERNIFAGEPYTGVIKFPFECPALEDILRRADGKIYGYDPIDGEEFYISDDLCDFFVR